MEFRASRGRGGSGKRGGRGGYDGDSQGGEHRGRGRREQHRGRGGGGGHAADSSRRQDHEDQDDLGSDDHVTQTFSRRKLESNWNRYEASETQEVQEDMPTQRGTDYSVLLQSAGDSFTQFRFADEKDWEMDAFVASQMSALVDLSALAQSLQQVPLHHRLNLEAQLIQVSTPVELPSLQDMSRSSAAAKASAPLFIKTMPSSEPPKPAPSHREDLEQELDELLSLQDSASTENNVCLEEEPKNSCEEVKENVLEVGREKEEMEEEVQDKHVRKELTEEELEDWLDSMIS